jgi:hypothetical protein
MFPPLDIYFIKLIPGFLPGIPSFSSECKLPPKHIMIHLKDTKCLRPC